MTTKTERTPVKKLAGYWNSKQNRSVGVDFVGMSFKECLCSELSEIMMP